ADPHGDWDDLRVDPAGGGIVVAGLNVQTIARLPHLHRETHAAVITKHRRCPARQRHICSHNARSTRESPPCPGRSAGGGGAVRNFLREIGVAAIDAASADEIYAPRSATKLKAIICGESVDIGVTIHVSRI